jgi:hypothetical protein
MQRWISILAVVLGVQLVLALALGMGRDRLSPSPVNTPLVAADLKNVDRLALDGPVAGGQAKADAPRVELARRDGRWVLPGYHDAPADAARVQALLDQLGSVKRGFAVARSADAIKRFKVADTDYERRLVASTGDKPVATVYLGQSPGLRKVNARTAQDEAVYAVELNAQELPAAPADWLDGGLLRVDAAALSEITVSGKGRAPLTLQRAVANGKPEGASAPASAAIGGAPPAAGTDGWHVPGLAADKRVDPEQTAALLAAIVNLRVDGVLGKEARPEWQQDAPDLSLSFKPPQGQAVTWTLAKAKSGDMVVLKASNQPWYLQLKPAGAQPLLEAAAADKLVVAAAPAPAAAGSAAGKASLKDAVRAAIEGAK